MKPKYRLLNTEELKTLEKEFVEFLVVNGITAEDWESIKKETPQKADEVLVLFSDVILEGSLRKIEYLKKTDGKELYYFKFGTQEAFLIWVTQEEGRPVIKKTVKKYKTTREHELFYHLQQGCEIDKQALFEQF